MNKARAFNTFLCAKTDKLMALIAEVQVQMSGYEAYYETRKRARRPADQATYDRTVDAILCDLCAVELGPNNDSIHLPLSNKVLRSKSRYKVSDRSFRMWSVIRTICLQPLESCLTLLTSASTSLSEYFPPQIRSTRHQE